MRLRLVKIKHHTRNTSKIDIHAFSHTKSQIRFFDVFPGFSLFFRLTVRLTILGILSR